jgi:NADH-quinone oxidoreductase subunit M
MFFALAALGLPGMGNFVGEFLVVLGVYRVSAALAAIAAVGFIVSTAYSLWMMQRAFFGENSHGWRIPDLSAREMAIVILMVLPLLWLGFYPQPFIDIIRRPVPGTGKGIAPAQTAGSHELEAGWRRK